MTQKFEEDKIYAVMMRQAQSGDKKAYEDLLKKLFLHSKVLSIIRLVKK